MFKALAPWWKQILHTSNGVLIVHQSPFTVLTALSLCSITSGEMLLFICWNEDITVLSTTTTSRALLRSSTKSP